jgi:hypothetical protein
VSEYLLIQIQSAPICMEWPPHIMLGALQLLVKLPAMPHTALVHMK